ncbi:MAG: AI-2E family transporter [Anaerolineae bacterium]|nr:AI-2E family transporter [Anaerolineae bacterium]
MSETMDQPRRSSPETGREALASASETLVLRPSATGWWRSAGLLALGIVLGLGTLEFIGMFGHALALLLLGVVLAQGLAPVVATVGRWLPRPLAIVLVYLVILFGFVIAGWLVLPALVAQVSALLDRAPQAIEALDDWLTDRGVPNIPDVIEVDSALLQDLLGRVAGLGAGLLAVPAGVATLLLDVGLVLFVSIYWLIDMPKMHRFVSHLLPERRRDWAERLTADVGRAIGGYVRGSILDALIVGLLSYLGLLIIGVPYALALGVLAALMEVIPNIGPIIAGAFMVATAWTVSPTRALITLAFVLVLQQVEGQLLVPMVMRGQTHLSPVLTIVAIFAGASVAGLLGVFVAIPLVAAMRVLVSYLLIPAVRRWTGADQVTSSGQVEAASEPQPV